LLREAIDVENAAAVGRLADLTKSSLRVPEHPKENAMTRRERLERKLEKRREWAAGRQADAAAHFQASHNIFDSIPMRQPILVGHHSERAHRRALERSDNHMHKGCESADMAKLHEQKADGIAAQLERSEFSDDDDALERLQAGPVLPSPYGVQNV
jgi:hypothetical protein